MKQSSYPLVSVIVRTCQRPQILRRALESIRRQTYPNIETVIVEDGASAAEEMLRKEYQNFRYIYESTGIPVGRSAAGNWGLKLSKGKYINFLDDDDGFLPEHIERLVKEIEQHKEKAVYAAAQERQILPYRTAGNKTRIRRCFVRYRQPFYRLLLYTENYIPIQSILFARSLYEDLGGLDESLEVFEDWDLWVRYSTVTDFRYIDRVTSYYVVPYSRRKKKERAGSFKDGCGQLYDNFQKYQAQFTVSEINKEMLYIIRQYKEHQVVRYLRMFVRIVLLGER